jgi:hypothetical protein
MHFCIDNTVVVNLNFKTMKAIKLFFVSALAGVSSFVFTGDLLAVDLVPVDIPDRSVFKLVAPSNHMVAIDITNPEGEILHRESVSLDEASIRLYDFTNLEDGVYTFYSSDEYSTTTKKIHVMGSGVEILRKEVEYKPVFHIREKKLTVSYLNQELDDVEFTIEGKNLNYCEDKMGNAISIQKQFDISRLPRGDYYALVKVGNKQYYHQFNID